MKTGITLKNKDIRGFAAESALFWVRAMFSQAAGTREGKDIEHLHDMAGSLPPAARVLSKCSSAFYAPREVEERSLIGQENHPGPGTAPGNRCQCQPAGGLPTRTRRRS